MSKKGENYKNGSTVHFMPNRLSMLQSFFAALPAAVGPIPETMCKTSFFFVSVPRQFASLFNAVMIPIDDN